MERIAIIADDLTGANDTGVQFCKHGFRTMVIIDAANVGQVGRDKDVWAINADTRHMTVPEAYRRVYEIALKLKEAAVSRVYKKIDSTLRGHPGAELEAVMDAWQAGLALVVPAFPANRRVVVDGHLLISESTVMAATSASCIPDCSGQVLCHIPTVLQKEMTRQVGQINLAMVRRGWKELADALEAAQTSSQVLVLDAADEEDLMNIARAISHVRQDVIVAGAAGLAAHLTMAWNLKPLTFRSFKREGTVLFIAGSRNPVTAAQVQRLAEFSACLPVQVDTAAILAGNEEAEIKRVLQEAADRENKDLLIIAVASLFQLAGTDAGAEKNSKPIAAALGTITSRLLGSRKIKSLVVTGGDTAVHVCRALAARGINLSADLLPGIPLGYLEGGPADGLPIVTKAGGFGPPEAFIEVFRYLTQE
ncbi:D-threonate kinase [Moorella humiferrea]|uniref:four-carbon acid sugar kinase family protein n=1 Tax=Neomoorella humiferrea TaxID=676965 RepID=UPI0030D0552F